MDPATIQGLLEGLAAGGDVATVAIFYLLWRLNDRVRVLEIHAELRKGQ